MASKEESSGSIQSGSCFSFRVLNGGGHWIVPKFLFESKKLIPALQQLLTEIRRQIYDFANGLIPIIQSKFTPSALWMITGT